MQTICTIIIRSANFFSVLHSSRQSAYSQCCTKDKCYTSGAVITQASMKPVLNMARVANPSKMDDSVFPSRPALRLLVHGSPSLSPTHKSLPHRRRFEEVSNSVKPLSSACFHICNFCIISSLLTV